MNAKFLAGSMQGTIAKVFFVFSISMIQYEEWLSSNWGGPSARVNHHCTIVE
jgi:hypothetical protein